jgi:signal transduction histidine kinase
MPPSADVIELPVRRERRDSLEHEAALALATADDLDSAIVAVLELVGRTSAATRIEWWTSSEDGAPELLAAAGIECGMRRNLPLGRAGTLVIHGGRPDSATDAALTALAPVFRHRAAEERLERTAIQLARRNQALEDFAALVAHELKTPLHAALVADDPASFVEDALDLVDTLLEAAQTEPSAPTLASPADSLQQAVTDLGADVEVTADFAATLPLPPGALRVILRNLLSNAVSAGARHVHVAAVESQLLVDDDGVGLADVGGYVNGSGLGLSLSRRIAGRFGGAIELAPGPSGGTRATLEFAVAA